MYDTGDEPKCVDCHSDLIESSVTHAPATESCDVCHLVDIKDHTENGAKGLHLSEELPGLCYNCHDDLKSDIKGFTHPHEALNDEKKCASCHSPHSSDEKKLLNYNQKKLCLGCHNKDVNAKGEKVRNIKKLLLTSKVIHPPVENGGCSVCHQPHGSANNYLLISAFPADQYVPAVRDTFEFCWECHDSDLLELEKTTASTNFRDGERNLHYVHMHGNMGRSCVMCHNVHASNNTHLIEDKVGFGDWDLPIKYVADENGGSCFPGCHGEKKYTR
jgi:predicted CXXCH cytochrome family protein